MVQNEKEHAVAESRGRPGATVVGGAGKQSPQLGYSAEPGVAVRVWVALDVTLLQH